MLMKLVVEATCSPVPLSEGLCARARARAPPNIILARDAERDSWRNFLPLLCKKRKREGKKERRKKQRREKRKKGKRGEEKNLPTFTGRALAPL